MYRSAIENLYKWKKQFNIVQRGDNISKYDIISRNEDHSQAGKGVTLTLKELIELKKVLNSLEI